MLLFKPWNDCDSLLGTNKTYTEAFCAFKEESEDAVHYHNRLQLHERNDKTVRIQIDKRRTQMESEEENASEGGQENEPLLCAVSEAQEAMADFEAALNDNDGGNVDGMIESLNEDQLRVFETVKNSVQIQCLSLQAQNAKPLRMFISGCGGTGKAILLRPSKLECHRQQTNMLQSLLQQGLLPLA